MERNVKYFFIGFLLLVIFLSISTQLPPRQRGGFFSDEASYFSITQSLVYDFDLKYGPEDLPRIKQYFPTGPVGFQLKKGSDGQMYYAKSFAYPLFAAPFFALFRVNGMLLFNGLMLFLVVLMAYLLLKQYHPEKNSLGFALVFVLCSVAPIYIWWMTADLFNFFIMFCGLFFFFYPFKRPWLFYFSAFFFSTAVFSKPWIVFAVMVIYFILLYYRQWKKFILLSLFSALAFSGFVLFYYAQTGELSYKLYMGGERRQFTTQIPFDAPGITFESGISMSFDTYWDRFYLTPEIVADNLFYYFFGRYTGMFIYFVSAFFIMVLFFFQSKTPEDWFIFAALWIVMLVFMLLAPDNYFGGSGSVGNRYFFMIFPVFFFLGFKNRIFKYNSVPIVLTLIFLSGTYLDSHYHSTTPRLTGISYPACLFPPEKTQYLSLPTNENPRAFGNLMHSGERTYQVFFVNDNFHTVENDYFWSKGDKEVEFFLVAPAQVTEFEVVLESKKKQNHVRFEIEYAKKSMVLDEGKTYTIRFKKIAGLKMKNKYIYLVKAKSALYYCGYRENRAKDTDQRELGVRIQIGVVY